MPQQYAGYAAYAGPFPPPIILAQYEESLKGTAERIIALTEEEARHRRTTESRLLLIHFAGILFAFFLTIFIVGMGAYVILQGHGLAGALICGVGSTGLIGMFIHGTKTRANPPQ